MKSNNPLRILLPLVVVAVVIYAITYWAIEYRRTRLGPWQVSFTSSNNVARLVINEANLNITNFTIEFLGVTNVETNHNFSFAQPQEVPFAVPFGQCIFEDTTFQPGTVVFQLLGHEVQLLPRTLTVDKQEYAWEGKATLVFPARLNTTNISRGAL